ncbi:MAG: DoxX family membrane protein [Chloroflexi bacterium]|nr:DoxX family membrane protein [Chloroflexota bacterium]
MAGVQNNAGGLLQNPKIVTAVFSSTEYAWIWLIARTYVGYAWLDAGWHKITDDGWMVTGVALKGFWQRAVTIPETGRPPIAFDWYRELLQFLLSSGSHVWFAKLIAIGEFVVGLALLIGLFVGIAAFFGAFLNWNFMLAGSASTNPVLGLIGIGVMIAWKTSGWWGLDRFILPYVGAPWQRGKLFGGERLVVSGSGVESSRLAIEEWVRMLAGVGLGLYALVSLSGAMQVAVLLVAGVIVGVTGLGLFPILRSAPTK